MADDPKRYQVTFLAETLPRGVLYGRWNAWGRQRELPPTPRESFRDLYRQHRRARDG